MSSKASKTKTSSAKTALLAPEHVESLDPHRVLALVPIRPYHVIADLHAGSGYFTIPFAKYLFDGKVYAIEASQEQGETLKKELGAIRLENVEVLPGDLGKFTPPQEGLDGALIPFVLSAASDRSAFLKSVGNLLKKSAWAAVLEWYKRETKEGPPLEQRLSEEEVMALAKETGFRFSEKRDLNGKHYLVILRK